jgi:8-oxo-dGTP pyrophosphatase MutT (NUDIX family)
LTNFEDSHLGQLRALVGSQLLLVPGARIVVENDAGEILLQHRADLLKRGLPGGNAEPGEDLQDVIVREVLEETGLTIVNATPFAFGCNPALETVTFPNGDQCQFFVLLFHTRTYRGTLQTLDGESLDLRWHARDALPDMLPNMRASVEAFERHSSTGAFQMV